MRMLESRVGDVDSSTAILACQDHELVLDRLSIKLWVCVTHGLNCHFDEIIGFDLYQGLIVI